MTILDRQYIQTRPVIAVNAHGCRFHDLGDLAAFDYIGVGDMKVPTTTPGGHFMVNAGVSADGTELGAVTIDLVDIGIDPDRLNPADYAARIEGWQYLWTDEDGAEHYDLATAAFFDEDIEVSVCDHGAPLVIPMERAGLVPVSIRVRNGIPIDMTILVSMAESYVDEDDEDLFPDMEPVAWVG